MHLVDMCIYFFTCYKQKNCIYKQKVDIKNKSDIIQFKYLYIENHILFKEVLICGLNLKMEKRIENIHL